MNFLRRSEYVPSMAESDTQCLRGTPRSWEQQIEESAVEGLRSRAYALAAALKRAGREREAAELNRLVALFERADELHRHASDVETIAGLYRALATLAHEQVPAAEHERTWQQSGVLEGSAPVAHGPAFRETAALRNRAYRLVAATVARYGRAVALPPTARRTR
jgi:hypothetical protein